MKHSLLSVVLVLFAASAYAGEIRGRVSNAQGDAVVGATVRVSVVRKGPQKHFVSRAVTGADGTYIISGLDPRSYILTVSIPSRDDSPEREVSIKSATSSVLADFEFPATPGKRVPGPK
jgi:hypothetical protein